MWFRFMQCFLVGFAPLLWIAAGIVFLSWKPFGTPPSNSYNLILAIALLVVIFLSGQFQFYQELTTSKALAGFHNLLPNDCIVIRNGDTLKLPASVLVIGDIVCLQTGARVPADMRIISCTNLKIDKSLLTGESEPIKLQSEKVISPNVNMLESNNMAFMGCNVVEGEGKGVVIAVGQKNQLSKIAAQVIGVQTTQSTLQREINRFVMMISSIALMTVIIVVFVWVFYLRIRHPGFMNTSSMIANAISVLVAFIPEGLPLALSMGLSIIANRLCVKHSILLKRLSTIETLGSMSMLASDKTGTLTQNRMTVTGIITLSNNYIDIDINSTPVHIKSIIVRLCTLCNQSQLEAVEGTNVRKAVGSNGIDRSLLQYAEMENNIDSIKSNYQIKLIIPFSSKLKMTMAIVYGSYENHDTSSQDRGSCSMPVLDNSHFILLKGSPEYVLMHCSFYFDDYGNILPISASQLTSIKSNIERICNTGCRVISCAQSYPLDYNVYDNNYIFSMDPCPNFPLDGYIYISSIAVSDPPREGVREAVIELRTAGIKVAMVTGDAAATAVAVARQVGIIGEKSYTDTLSSMHINDTNDVENRVVRASYTNQIRSIVVEGSDLQNITSIQWDHIFQCPELIFARTTPEQKLLIVKEIQQRGYRVGVTGDGVNDSPALKRADIGIAMQDGSDVSRDAAAIILMTNDFRAIVHGVREGRLIFSNLRKVIGYQIAAGCWSELLPVLATFFLGMPQPLSSFLMIIISCVTDVAAGVALTNELPERNIMLEPPRNVLLSPLVDLKLIAYSYLFYGNMQSLGAFFNYFHYMSNRGPTNMIIGSIPSNYNRYEYNITFPIAYKPLQLIGAWNWGLDNHQLGADEEHAAKIGSSVFFLTLVISQMGHLVSIRKKTPYFSDAIINVDNLEGNIWIRIWKEICQSPPLPAILIAWIISITTILIFTEIPAVQEVCGTGKAPSAYWGMAVGWSVLWFIIAEIRKWIIILCPSSFIGRTAW